MPTYTIFAGVNGCGKSIIRNINIAKSKGFYIVMNYIGVENPEIAKERVKLRVSKGGHGIPEEDIERRYYESLENLNKIIEVCDEVNIYDNTDRFKEISWGRLAMKPVVTVSWSNLLLSIIIIALLLFVAIKIIRYIIK